MSTPKLTEVYLVERRAKLVKCPNCGGVHLPIGKTSGGSSSSKGPGFGKAIRGGSAEGDPFKTGVTGERFQTDHGVYHLFRVDGDKYEATFIDGEKATPLGESPSRREMIDVVLFHHDQVAAGLL